MAGKLLKYLPKPTSFSIPTTTGGGAAAPYRAGFSGPINISIVPKEARRKAKKRSEEPDFEEPTSPKVSCIGQVKNKHKKKKKIVKNKKEKEEEEEEKIKIQKIKKPSALQSMFSRKVRPGRAAAAEVEAAAVVVPEIGMMRRFRSGRETLGDFDWRKAVEREDDDDDDEFEDEILVPHSAPILMGGGGVVAAERKKKEAVNLWKRRTLSPPKSLQV